MSIIVISTPVIIKDPPKSVPAPEVIEIGNSRVEFRDGRPKFGDLCRAVIDLFRAWRS